MIQVSVKRAIAAMAMVSAMMTGAAWAQQNGQAQDWACSEEAARLCPDVKPGGGRVAACLIEQNDQLSDGCKAALRELTQRIKGFGEVCGADITRFCADVQPGGGRVAQCLGKNRSQLEPACADVLPGS